MVPLGWLPPSPGSSIIVGFTEGEHDPVGGRLGAALNEHLLF
jgi:hypothetical protein